MLCEKPLAPTPKQTVELFEAAKEKGVFLMEAYAYLHSPFVTALKKEIEEGTIGEIRYIESQFLTSFVCTKKIMGVQFMILAVIIQVCC